MIAQDTPVSIVAGDLTLRLPAARDVDTYAAFFADAQASAFYGGPLRRDQAFDVLCKDVGHWALKGHGKFMIARNGDTLGGCGIVHPDGWPSHELTWWLMPAARGRGVARRASRAVLEWAREWLGLTTVETHFNDDNAPARGLAHALGGSFLRRDIFPDGVTRDVFAISTQGAMS